MPIIEPCFRPPSEAESILLQVTCGCSCNTCTFCGAYKRKPFRIKPVVEIFSDIEYYRRVCPDKKKLFLMDGDALVVNNAKLMPVLKRIGKRLPRVNRVSSYANGSNITDRSAMELRELYSLNLKLIYIGLESGNQEILDLCEKKSSVRQMIDAVIKAADAGIYTSLMVLLGLGGRKRSRQHIEDSAAAINLMQPRFLSFLSLMLVAGTKLHDQAMRGEFEPLDAHGFLEETFEILKRLQLKQTLFSANHASNYLPIQGRLPQAKDDLLKLLEAAIIGRLVLKPDVFRGV